tara:strand:- start:2586 stop:3890 length:1305 start_codon:yes stop_codon:yes gene_type:complete
MRKYILIYAYTSLFRDELKYWNDLSVALYKKGFHLVLLSPQSPGGYHHFINELFIERLDWVKINGSIDSEITIDYSKYLERENIWYGSSNYDRLSAAKIQREKYVKILDELNPCFVLVSNGQHASEIILIDEIKKRNTPHGFFERGCLTKSWHYDDIGITAGTTIANKGINQIELPSNTFLYDSFKKNYLNKKETWWSQPSINSALNIRDKYSIDVNTKLILFVNQLDNDTSNFLYSPFFQGNIDAFRWFLNTMKGVDCFVIAKKHPMYDSDDENFKTAFKELGVNGVWVDNISLFDCLEQSDFVCTVNSTVIYEALIYEKPVLQMGQSIISNKDIVYELKSLEELRVIDDWLNSEKLKQRLVLFKRFMSYMIDKELSFFSYKTKGSNDFSLFLSIILERLDSKRKGQKTISFGTKKNFKFSIKRYLILLKFLK